MTVKFLRDFDYRETDYKTIAYEADWIGEVAYECAMRAIETGAAEEHDVLTDEEDA